ncbi:hypothetical protein COL47_28265 [Bacillus toyonensis]|nr:hypothetical protein COL47_28265 [Bacillus toyonensis]
MPTFIKFIKDNKKLYGKTAFCIKIYLKLMEVGYCPMPIKLKIFNTLRTIFLIFDSNEAYFYRFWGNPKY